jgi:hypothetical protein
LLLQWETRLAGRSEKWEHPDLPAAYVTTGSHREVVMRPTPSEVEIKVVVHGETITLIEPVPDGFPQELIPILADYMRRGYEACRVRLEVKELPSFAEVAEPLRSTGRRSKPELVGLGRRIDKLRKEGRSYGQITRRICPDKDKHRCGKKCIDRIRQVYKYWQKQQKQLEFERELTSSFE